MYSTIGFSRRALPNKSPDENPVKSRRTIKPSQYWEHFIKSGKYAWGKSKLARRGGRPSPPTSPPTSPPLSLTGRPPGESLLRRFFIWCGLSVKPLSFNISLLPWRDLGIRSVPLVSAGAPDFGLCHALQRSVSNNPYLGLMTLPSRLLRPFS